MRVRRFTGDNVADTMGKVKRELGSEAVILQTREYREGGFLGLFGKMRVEISAAIEEKPMAAPKLSDPGYGYYVDDSVLPKVKSETVFNPERNLERDLERNLERDLERNSLRDLERDLERSLERNFERNDDTKSYAYAYGGADHNLNHDVSATVKSGPDTNFAADVKPDSNQNPDQNSNLNLIPNPSLNLNANLNAYRNAAELNAGSKTGVNANLNDDRNGKLSADSNPTIAANPNSELRSDFTQVDVKSNMGLNPNANAKPNSNLKAKYNPEVRVDASLEQSGSLQEEIMAMRRMLEKMNKQMEGMGEYNGVWPQALQKWADFLADRGINENLVKLLIKHVQQTLSPEEWLDNELVFARLEANVRQICGQIGPIQPGLDKPRVVALIGATGVGKTTTIGKLAAGFSIVDKRRVALITVDTYRVAAVEQLKTFGEIIGVPVKVVMNPAGLREAIDSFADRELIFIDTAGRSPYHDLHMADLREFLEQARPDFTMLVLSATTQYADQLKVYRRFESLTTHLIFTKLDETGSAGSILNILGQTTLPTAYLTNGQNVPDDIEAATPSRLTRCVLGVEMPNA